MRWTHDAHRQKSQTGNAAIWDACPLTGFRLYGDRMSNLMIRPAYSMWPTYNRRLRDVVAELTVEQLAIKPAPDREMP